MVKGFRQGSKVLEWKPVSGGSRIILGKTYICLGMDDNRLITKMVMTQQTKLKPVSNNSLCIHIDASKKR